jgi:general secretion pathway protein C
MAGLKHWILHEAGIALLELGLVALLAAGLAYWTWIAIAPVATAASDWPASPSVRDRDSPKLHLFGVASSDIGGAAVGGVSNGVKLLGVFSSRAPGKGRAILAQPGGKAQALVAGDAIAEGIVLKEVFPDHVILLRSGVPERIDLERAGSRPPPPAPVARPARR